MTDQIPAEAIEDERGALSELLFTIYDHGTLPNALREADVILAAGFTRRPMPSRDDLAAMLNETPQSEGSDWAYALADAVLALFKGAEG